jgi:transcriptional regulator with XRE-family HTH domain
VAKNEKMKNNISTSLGLKQKELAQLLQVSRSQLSLYELGKRSLPVHAMEKLAVMLSLSQKKAPKSEKKKSNAVEEQKLLQKLLLKNRHQQLLVERKIKALEKKQNALATSKKLIAHLLKNESKLKKNELAVLKSVEVKSNNQTIANYATLLLQLEIKKEVLVFEEKLLRKKL